MDLTDLTDGELEDLQRRASVELERRQVASRLPEQIDRLVHAYLTGTGRESGQPWVQPTGAHDSYPEGWEVTHDGKTWVSLTPANVWPPGVSGWREVPAGGDGGEPAVPEWVAPTGAHDTYATGDRVTFQGQVWQSALDGNTWSPADYPAAWTLIS